MRFQGQISVNALGNLTHFGRHIGHLGKEIWIILCKFVCFSLEKSGHWNHFVRLGQEGGFEEGIVLGAVGEDARGGQLGEGLVSDHVALVFQRNQTSGFLCSFFHIADVVRFSQSDFRIAKLANQQLIGSGVRCAELK